MMDFVLYPLHSREKMVRMGVSLVQLTRLIWSFWYTFSRYLQKGHALTNDTRLRRVRAFVFRLIDT